MSRLILAEQAVAPSTPSAGKVAIYADNTATPLAKFLDDSGVNRTLLDGTTVVSQITNKDFDATTTTISDVGATSKAVKFALSGMTASVVLTFSSSQTTTQTLTFPNIAGASILITDTLAQTITGVKTMTNPTTAAGTNLVASATFTAGTILDTPVAGAWEKDSLVFYSTPIANARGLSPSVMFAIVPAAGFSLLTTSGVQSCFPTTSDIWTLNAATSYFFEGAYYITHSTTSCTTAMAFLAAASLTITSMAYGVSSVINAANGAPAAPVSTWVNQLATTVVTATSTVGWAITFAGIIRVNAGGTLTPQINFSAATTAPVMAANSFIRFTPLGTNVIEHIGNVA